MILLDECPMISTWKHLITLQMIKPLLTWVLKTARHGLDVRK